MTKEEWNSIIFGCVIYSKKTGQPRRVLSVSKHERGNTVTLEILKSSWTGRNDTTYIIHDRHNFTLKPTIQGKEIMGCKKGELEYAKQEACHRFDKWVDVTGFVQRHTSYYYELKSIIEETVDISFAVAFEQPIPEEG